MKKYFSLLALLFCLAFAIMLTSAQEATPEVTPEATAEVTPEATPESTPESDDDDSGIIIVVEGPVQAININIIVIYNINIVIKPQNPILTLIAIGDIVRVEGELDDDGTIVANNVTNFVNDNGLGTVLIEGNIQAINANIITINNLNVELAANDPILATLKIGDYLSVDGNFSDDDDDGNFVLIVITVIIISPDYINVDTGEICNRGMGMGNGNGNCKNKNQGNNGNGNGNNGNGNGNGNNDDDDDDD